MLNNKKGKRGVHNVEVWFKFVNVEGFQYFSVSFYGAGSEYGEVFYVYDVVML